MEHLEELYCHIDDFCKQYLTQLRAKQVTLKSNNGKKTHNKPCSLSLSEIITLLVLFHQLRYREFKSFYFNYVCRWLKREFPKLPSYQRMVELVKIAILPMSSYLQFLMQGNCTGISFIDSTSIEHTRHRSVYGFMSNLLAGLITYCHQSHKPTLKNVLIEPTYPKIG